jgi:hypothetical protein
VAVRKSAFRNHEKVASRLFGTDIAPDAVIDETLERVTDAKLKLQLLDRADECHPHRPASVLDRRGALPKPQRDWLPRPRGADPAAKTALAGSGGRQTKTFSGGRSREGEGDMNAEIEEAIKQPFSC